MKEYLQDFVRTMTVLPFGVIRVMATPEETKIQTKTDDTTVVLFAKTKKPVKEFDGVFGFNNIGMLAGLLAHPSFRDTGASVELSYQERNGVKLPEEIKFKADKNASASYRLVAEKAIPAQFQKIANIEWDVIVQNPNKNKIAEFGQLASIYQNEAKFSIKVDGGEVRFLVGQENSSDHKASYTFATVDKGEYNATYTWNIQPVLNVLKLNNAEITMKISSKGALQIDVDTGLTQYEFVFMGSN